MIKVKDICYIIENWTKVCMVEVLSIQGEFYTVKFLERPRPSAAKLIRSRLYLTEEEARKEIDEKPNIEKINNVRNNNLQKYQTYWPCGEHKH